MATPWLSNALILILCTAGERGGRAGGSVCGDLLPASLGRESRLAQPAVLHLHLRHHDWGGGGAVYWGPRPLRQVRPAEQWVYGVRWPVLLKPQ